MKMKTIEALFADVEADTVESKAGARPRAAELFDAPAVEYYHTPVNAAKNVSAPVDRDKNVSAPVDRDKNVSASPDESDDFPRYMYDDEENPFDCDVNVPVQRNTAPPLGRYPSGVPANSQDVRMASDPLQQLWRSAARSDLSTVLLPRAVRTLNEVMCDRFASPSARVSAAKTVLDKSLPDAEHDQGKKTVAAMSSEEITSALIALRAQLGKTD